MAKIVTFGEIMMRLAPPGFQRLIQSTQLDVTYAGGEANVAVSLAAFGHEALYVTAVPQNPMGEAALGTLRYYGVNTDHSIKVADGRLGIYFLETGASQRASTVLYDRADSAIARIEPNAFDWTGILTGCDALHTTGITPALSDACAAATQHALQTAKSFGLYTSFDLNYRRKLWSQEKARKTVEPLLKYVDLVIGNEEDAKDVLGISAEKTDIRGGQIAHEAYEQVARQIQQRFGSRAVAITLRESESASVNHWSAALLSDDKFYLSRRYSMHVVDRVGAGDSFCGGLLAALLEQQPPQQALEFAVAASCLKHSIPGDFNKVTRAEVQRLCGGDASGRVVR